MLEYSTAATPSIVPGWPWFPQGGNSLMGLSRSCSTAGQWDGLAASTPSPSFPWDCFPEGKRGCGKEEDLGLPQAGSSCREQGEGWLEKPWDEEMLTLFPCRNPTGIPWMVEVLRQASRAQGIFRSQQTSSLIRASGAAPTQGWDAQTGNGIWTPLSGRGRWMGP